LPTNYNAHEQLPDHTAQFVYTVYSTELHTSSHQYSKWVTILDSLYMRSKHVMSQELHSDSCSALRLTALFSMQDNFVKRCATLVIVLLLKSELQGILVCMYPPHLICVCLTVTHLYTCTPWWFVVFGQC